MFNNAGIVVMDLAERHELADWDRIIDVNVRGVVNGVAAAYPRMLGQGFGHIVNTASMAGLLPCPMEAGYTMTKHAVVGLTHALRLEGASRGIRATAICPGLIRTRIGAEGTLSRLSQELTAQTGQERTREVRMMEPEELARRVLRRLPRNPAKITEPRYVTLLDLMNRHCPRLSDQCWTWAFARSQRQIAKAAETSDAD